MGISIAATSYRQVFKQAQKYYGDRVDAGFLDPLRFHRFEAVNSFALSFRILKKLTVILQRSIRLILKIGLSGVKQKGNANAVGTTNLNSLSFILIDQFQTEQ